MDFWGCLQLLDTKEESDRATEVRSSYTSTSSQLNLEGEAKQKHCALGAQPTPPISGPDIDRNLIRCSAQLSAANPRLQELVLEIQQSIYIGRMHAPCPGATCRQL
jgi:hypothetical protein